MTLSLFLDQHNFYCLWTVYKEGMVLGVGVVVVVVVVVVALTVDLQEVSHEGKIMLRSYLQKILMLTWRNTALRLCK
jgi:hypothetical protein